MKFSTPEDDNCLSVDMVDEAVLDQKDILGHKISKSGIKVDRAKINVIAKLPYPTNLKGVRSFLGHAGFYRRLENSKVEKLNKEAITDSFPDEHLMAVHVKEAANDP
ncbi:hypothetical protein Tco_0965071 [Tanacetum coccineum]